MRYINLLLFVSLLIPYKTEAQVFYGLTSRGGGYSNAAGTLFSIDSDGNNFQTRKVFTVDYPGSNPVGNLVEGPNGKLYGVTTTGGKQNLGVIFSYEIATGRYESVYDFGYEAYKPTGELTIASDGNLYGLLAGGIDTNGVAFRYNWSTDSFNIIFHFNYSTGSGPTGTLIQADDGMLYGMTRNGGTMQQGVLFSYNLSSSIYTSLVDLSDSIGSNCMGRLLQFTDGKLYGATSVGGLYNAGTLFCYDRVSAQYSVLHHFHDTTGVTPNGGLVAFTDGKMYGTTYGGGKPTNFPLQGGTIYSYDPIQDTLQVVFSFNPASANLVSNTGYCPNGNLLAMQNGKLYGMTTVGGFSGLGVVYSYHPTSNTFQVLLNFGPSYQGTTAICGLHPLGDTAFLGMTHTGGSNYDCGIMFKYEIPSGIYTKLFDFNSGCAYSPYSNLTQAANGKFYSTTFGGGNGNGTIFCYDAEIDSVDVVYNFGYYSSRKPNQPLLSGWDGVFYSNTRYGGNYNTGTIYSFDPRDSSFSDIHTYGNLWTWATNGSYPVTPPILGADGLLYGTTEEGGSNSKGTLYRVNLSGSYVSLFSFNDTTGQIAGNILILPDAKIYGTTAGSNLPYAKSGTLFSYNIVNGQYETLMYFNDSIGKLPGSLTYGSDGYLYGLTYSGGYNNNGVVFRFQPITRQFEVLHYFDGTNGGAPRNWQLTIGRDQKIYGVTTQGGVYGMGLIYKLDPTTKHFTKLFDFDENSGYYPFGGLTEYLPNMSSVSSTLTTSSFSLFPNPANTEIVVQNGSFIPEKVLIYNMSGQLMSDVIVTNNRIDVHALPAGVYFAEVYHKNSVQRIKWIKM